ncbi:transporter substrate-binding domain-containing protein [Litoreibacter albidus]|uniref:transporter substrate-binding domain-containing protein n=1 Tax=Litoreibacter albidus TaxID=670155 RepID=UPI003735D3A4
MTTDIASEFAPTGKLRVALNHGNRILVGREADGTPKGITVDLAQALATHLGTDLTFVEFDRAVDVSNSATENAWDVCFLAVDPKRAETIDFTDPYVRIEGRYLAAASCAAETADALVASGIPVGTVDGSAYTLTLSRKPGAEKLVTFPDIHAMLEALDAGEISAVAGIGDVMEIEAKQRAGARTLQPPFMEILQAMAIVKGRPNAAAHLRAFLSNLARSGGVGDILEAHGVNRDSAIVTDPT